MIIVNLKRYIRQCQQGTGSNTIKSLIWFNISIHIVFISSIPASNLCKVYEPLIREEARGSSAPWIARSSWWKMRWCARANMFVAETGLECKLLKWRMYFDLNSTNHEFLVLILILNRHYVGHSNNCLPNQTAVIINS